MHPYLQGGYAAIALVVLPYHDFFQVASAKFLLHVSFGLKVFEDSFYFGLAAIGFYQLALLIINIHGGRDRSAEPIGKSVITVMQQPDLGDSIQAVLIGKLL